MSSAWARAPASPFVRADAAHAWVHAYYNGITKRLQPLAAAYRTNPNIAPRQLVHVREDRRETRIKADGATFFQFCLRFYGARSDRRRPDAGTVNMWEEYNRWKRENPESAATALSGRLIGSPDKIRRKLRTFEASHIDQVILLNQAGGNTHEDICASLALFAREVMPEFHAYVPAHEAWKQQVLAAHDRL